jgi:uncharacterized protein (UPF0276 family)
MKSLPYLGAGISYRPRWQRDILDADVGLGCLEIIAEHFLNAPGSRVEELDQLASRFPLIPHGIGLSFGTDAPLDSKMLKDISGLVARVRPPWFTEHMSYTNAHGWNVGHLAPIPFTRESVDAIARNARRWRDDVGVPLLLENISYLVAIPGEMSEAEFITEVVEAADCGLLLDLHNVYANAVNHEYDPFEFIESLPLDRVAQIHLGGGHDDDGCWIDSHDTATSEPVWELLRYVAARADIKAVIVEWDKNLPPFEVMLAEAARAARILEEAGSGAFRDAGRPCAALHG